MVVAPGSRAVARPALVTIARAGWTTLQVAVAVRSCVLPSLQVPVAVYCRDSPRASVTFAGVTVMETRTGAPVPSDTTRSTTDPSGTEVPGTGAWLMTCPAGTVGWFAVVTVPTASFAATMAPSAAACGKPT